MARYDTIIRNGFIVDGTGGPAFRGDLAIRDGKVATFGKLRDDTATEEIDAQGKVVAPGFITQHAHYDAALFWDPYCSDSGEHGVTTILNANCGFSIAPVRASDRERTMAMLSTTEQIPVEQQRAAIPWTWETFPEYMAQLRTQPKGLNIMSYLPLNPLLIYVMGVEAAKTRRPTVDEMSEMHRLIDEAMDCGAVGISMSVMGIEGNSHLDFDGTPMPSDALHDDDVVEICRAVANRGEGVIQLLSQIGTNGNPELSAKVARMAKGTGARVLHNVFLTNDADPDMPRRDLAWLDALLAEGLDIVVATLIHCGWVEAGIRELDTAAGQMAAVREIIACRSDAAIMQLISDPAFVKRFSDEYLRDGPSGGAGGFEAQIIIEVGKSGALQPYLGRTLGDIATEKGQTVVETLCDLAARSNLDLQIKSAPFSAVDTRQAATLLHHSNVAAGVSDGGAHTKAFSSGNYGTDLLIRMVRDHKALTLEDLHHQLSFKIARTLQISDRGALLPGFWADLIIYDLDALYYKTDRMLIVHDMPGGDWRRLSKAGGYSRIMVNGITTHIDDKSTGAIPGQLLRTTRGPQPTMSVAAE